MNNRCNYIIETSMNLLFEYLWKNKYIKKHEYVEFQPHFNKLKMHKIYGWEEIKYEVFENYIIVHINKLTNESLLIVTYLTMGKEIVINNIKYYNKYPYIDFYENLKKITIFEQQIFLDEEDVYYAQHSVGYKIDPKHDDSYFLNQALKELK